MSAETETTLTRAKNSAGEQAKAAVEIQVCGFFLPATLRFFLIINSLAWELLFRSLVVAALKYRF